MFVVKAFTPVNKSFGKITPFCLFCFVTHTHFTTVGWKGLKNSNFITSSFFPLLFSHTCFIGLKEIIDLFFFFFWQPTQLGFHASRGCQKDVWYLLQIKTEVFCLVLFPSWMQESVFSGSWQENLVLVYLKGKWVWAWKGSTTLPRFSKSVFRVLSMQKCTINHYFPLFNHPFFFFSSFSLCIRFYCWLEVQHQQPGFSTVCLWSLADFAWRS